MQRLNDGRYIFIGGRALENLNPALPGDWPRTISINTMGFTPKVKRISDAQKAQLIESGRQGVRAFFGGRN